MSKDFPDSQNITAIRGATTSSGNTFKDIENAVVELIDELILRNSLDPKKILSITFTVTKDLDACFNIRSNERRLIYGINPFKK